MYYLLLGLRDSTGKGREREVLVPGPEDDFISHLFRIIRILGAINFDHRVPSPMQNFIKKKSPCEIWSAGVSISGDACSNRSI